ncbi:MAG: ComF family protein [bacterium]
MDSWFYFLIYNYSLISNFVFGNDKCISCNKICFNTLCNSCYLNINNNLKYFKIDKSNFNHFSNLYFNEAYSVDVYSNLLFLIKEYKFNNKIYLSILLSKMLEKLIDKYSLDFDLIINAPNHNFIKYTLYLCLNLSKIYKKPILNIVSISNNKIKQHFIENKLDRIKNAKNKYYINEKVIKKTIKTLENISLKLNKSKLNILIVDDIIKTGATINEISKLIRNTFKLSNNIIVISLAKA